MTSRIMIRLHPCLLNAIGLSLVKHGLDHGSICLVKNLMRGLLLFPASLILLEMIFIIFVLQEQICLLGGESAAEIFIFWSFLKNIHK